MKEIALYVHIPFCKSKCLYCDFPSYGGKDDLKKDYVRALIKEINEKCKDKKIKTLFIGGGTPSYLEIEELESLLKALDNLVYVKGAERTIECNPGTLNREKIKVIKQNGINRISMGLQTTNDNLLKDIGRIHTFDIFKENFNTLREEGIDNINVDLMFGLPNQTIDEFENTLHEVVNLNPEHISAYSLIIEEGTPFYKFEEKGLLNLPSEDDERKMYTMCKRILKDNGYHQYEVSNYAKKERECEHNKIYWNLYDYLGVGVSASSFINNKRIKNIDSIEEYIEKIENGDSIIEEVLLNSKKENMEEFMFLGLRLIEGVSIERFKEKFDEDIKDVYGDVIKKHKDSSFLIEDNGRLKFSENGIEVSNFVLADFIK